MKSLITLLVATFTLMPIVHGAPASTVPISQMPVTTNVLDNAYFPLIQPYPGRTTNDNFRATTASIFTGRGTGTFTNIYVTNLFVTNLIMLGGTNVASVNPTIGRIPYKDTTNTFGDSALYFIDTNTVGTVELDAETVGVTNLVAGGLVASVDTGLGYGVLTNIPFSDIALWTNDASILRPLFLQDVRMTNNRVYEQLRTDGAFVTAAQSINFLFAGTNQVNPFHQGMIFLASTISTNGAIVQLSTGDGTGAHIWLFNVFTNAPFTLPSGPLWDDPTQSVFVRGGAWSPTEPGESLELVNTGGGWDEIGRSNPNGPAPVTINPTDGYLPIRANSNTFFNSAIEQPGTNTVYVHNEGGGTTFFRFTTNGVANFSFSDSGGMQFNASTGQVAALNHDAFYTSVPFIFTPGITNKMYRSGTDIIVTNGGSDSKFTLYSGSGKGLSLEIQGATAALSTAGISVPLTLRSGADQVSLNAGSLNPVSDLSLDLAQPSGSAWNNLTIGGIEYVRGFVSGTNYSRLAISHTGTNGAVIFHSQSAGTAGTVGVPFAFTNAPIVLPWFTKAQKTALTPTNGMVLYQTDNTPGLRAYINGAWVILSTATDP